MAPDQFQQELAKYGQTATPAPAQPTPQPAQPQSHGNWFTHLLPTIGSIGGTILGGIGTMGLGGEVVGGAAGGGIGKALENALEGQKVIQGNDLTAGIEGGMGAGIGGVAGKVLGKAGEALGSRATNLANDAKAATQVAQDNAAAEATAQATRNNFGGAGVSRVRAANDLQGNQNLLQSWGLDHTSPQVMSNASKGGLFIDDIDKAALSKGAPIKTTDLLSSKDITTASPEEQQAMLDSGIITEDGKLPATVTPQQATDFAGELNGRMRTLQGLSDNAYGQGNLDSYNQAQQQLSQLSSKYNNVQKLATSPEADAEIAARQITPEEKDQLVKQYGQQQADHIEQQVNDAQTHQDLVKAKLPFAQMNTLSKLALQDAKDSASSRAFAREKADLNGDGIPDAVQQDPSIIAAAHNAAAGGGHPVSMLAKFVGQAKNNPNILNTLSRVANISSKAAAPVGAGIGASNAQIQDANGTMGGTMPPLQTDPTQQSPLGAATAPQGGLSREDLLTLALYSPTAFSSLTTPSAGQQQTVAAANTAEQALSSLGAAPGGGIMSQIQGHLGLGGTGEYQRKAAAAAQQIAAALPGSNAATIEKELTNYNAGSGNIDEAIKQLLSNLEAAKQNNTNGAYQQLMNYHPSVMSQVPVAQ